MITNSAFHRNPHEITIFFFAKNDPRTSAPEDSSCEVKAPESAWSSDGDGDQMADLKDIMVNLWLTYG